MLVSLAVSFGLGFFAMSLAGLLTSSCGMGSVLDVGAVDDADGSGGDDGGTEGGSDGAASSVPNVVANPLPLPIVDKSKKYDLGTLGVDYRGKAHMHLLRLSKQERRNERSLVKTRDDRSSLANVWNFLMLREGDACAEDSTKTRRRTNYRHNRWGTSGFLRLAWGDLGANRRSRSCKHGPVAIDGSHRSGDALSVLSKFFFSAETQELESLETKELKGAGSLVLRRHHDATPMLLRFGALQDVLEPHARYLVRKTDARGLEQWTCVRFDEYKKQYPRAATNKGVVEVLGQSVELEWTTLARLGGQLLQNRRRLMAPPMLLQAGNANCIYEAFGKCNAMFTIEGLKRSYGFFFTSAPTKRHRTCESRRSF